MVSQFYFHSKICHEFYIRVCIRLSGYVGDERPSRVFPFPVEDGLGADCFSPYADIFNVYSHFFV